MSGSANSQVNKMSVYKMLVNELPVDKLLVDELPVDELSVNELSVNEMSGQQNVWSTKNHSQPKILVSELLHPPQATLL